MKFRSRAHTLMHVQSRNTVETRQENPCNVPWELPNSSARKRVVPREKVKLSLVGIHWTYVHGYIPSQKLRTLACYSRAKKVPKLLARGDANQTQRYQTNNFAAINTSVPEFRAIWIFCLTGKWTGNDEYAKDLVFFTRGLFYLLVRIKISFGQWNSKWNEIYVHTL